MNGALVELDSVTKSYEQGSSEVHALTDVSLAVAEGEMVVLLGPSGSGKTTLLTVVGTIDPACSTTFWRRSD